MATEILAEGLPTTETTLSAHEFVRFIELLERELPEGTRGYLISIERDGSRKLSPVPTDADIIGMRAPGFSNLIDHLRGYRGEHLKPLHDFCLERMREQGIDVRCAEYFDLQNEAHHQSNEMFYVVALLSAIQDRLGQAEVLACGDEAKEYAHSTLRLAQMADEKVKKLIEELDFI